MYICMYVFEVVYQPEAVAELNELRAFHRVWVLEAIAKNLTEAPAMARGKKKQVDLGGGDFIWQLRVGDYRVFYDVVEEQRLVVVRHIRHKGRRSTGKIL